MADQLREKIAALLFKRAGGSPFRFGSFPGESLETQAYGHADAIIALFREEGVDLEGWRPIESAPKDGTRVLAWSANWTGVMTVQYYGTDWRPDYTLRLKYQPTHWRPLPKGPAHE